MAPAPGDAKTEESKVRVIVYMPHELLFICHTNKGTIQSYSNIYTQTKKDEQNPSFSATNISTHTLFTLHSRASVPAASASQIPQLMLLWTVCTFACARRTPTTSCNCKARTRGVRFAELMCGKLEKFTKRQRQQRAQYLFVFEKRQPGAAGSFGGGTESDESLTGG